MEKLHSILANIMITHDRDESSHYTPRYYTDNFYFRRNGDLIVSRIHNLDSPQLPDFDVRCMSRLKIRSRSLFTLRARSSLAERISSPQSRPEYLLVDWPHMDRLEERPAVPGIFLIFSNTSPLSWKKFLKFRRSQAWRKFIMYHQNLVSSQEMP